MAARPCKIVLDQCPLWDSPITNTSAEAPDPLLFAAQIFDPYNPFTPPRLGDGPQVDVDCNALLPLFASYNPILYAGTQLMANLQALAAQLGCPWPSTGNQVYGNEEQSYTLFCSDGSSFTYTVDAGTMVSPPLDPVLGAAFKEYANAWALSYAFDQASALLDCGTGNPDNPEPPGDHPPTFPSGPGILNNPSWLCFGEEYFDRYTIAGARNSAYTIEVISGAIPPGTAFNQTGPRKAIINGTPTAPGQYTWTIRAISASLPTTTVQFTDSLWVMGITNWDSLPDAEAGVPYGPEQLTATGGTAPYTFASSNLPTGFSLASDGTLTSDDTTIEDDYTFDVTVTDDNGGECVQEVNISVGPNTSLVCADCDWAEVLAAMSMPAGNPSLLPAWNGLFDQFTVWDAPNFYPMLYFTGFSIKGLKTSADESGPAYPSGNWQDTQIFTRLYWDGTNWQFVIGFEGTGNFWKATGGSSIIDPTGVYTYGGFGTPQTFNTVQINSHPDGLCVGMPFPAVWTGLTYKARVKDYSSVLPHITIGPPCLTPGGAPVWDGTMPSQITPGGGAWYWTPTDLGLPYHSNRDVSGFLGTNIQVTYIPGAPPVNGWFFQIQCSGGGTVWQGYKNTGETPAGIYIRLGGSSTTPNCIEIETY